MSILLCQIQFYIHVLQKVIMQRKEETIDVVPCCSSEELIESATNDSLVIETKLVEKLKKISNIEDTDTIPIPIATMTDNTLNQLTIEEMELLNTIPTITITTALTNESIKSLKTHAKKKDTTLENVLELAILDYDLSQRQKSFNSILFRNKPLKEQRIQVLMNFRKIIDLIENKPEITKSDLEVIIVKALPMISDQRSRVGYLLTLQNYSINVNGLKSSQILNLQGFREEIDELLSKYHGFKVGF